MGNLQYKVLQPLRIYGIAITPTTGTNGPVFLRTYGGDTVHYEPDPPDVDSSTLDLYAVLIQQEDSLLFVHVDSAKWHRRAPDKYFRYRSTLSTAPIQDTVVPVYEFFFDTPHEVHDSFYVGFRSDYVRSPNFDWSVSLYDHYPQQWVWSIQGMNIITHVGWHDYYVRTWYNEGWAVDRLGQRPLMRWTTMWGGIFPIIVPPDTDAVVGIPVLGFHRAEDYDGWPTFVWVRSAGQELYEVGYGRADQDPDSFRVVGTTISSLILRDSTLDSSVMYAARCRARHHHACALHDTTVWSEWTDTVHFMIGRPDTPSEGIRQAAAEVPTFTLSPNPTQDKVTVTLGQAAAPPCMVTLRDEQGRELLRQRMEEGTSLTLSTLGLAAGLYFVTLETPQGTSTQKLVVE